MVNLIQIPAVVNSYPINSGGFARMAYDIAESDDDNTEISIYDVIASRKSYDWWSDTEGTEVTPSDFKAQIDACSTNNITIRMNSQGGDVNSANVIAVAIQEVRAKGKHVVCKIDGLCASAAVQIATSCDEVIMHQSALMMIHNPMAFLYGYYNTNEMKTVDNMLTAVKNAIINHYIDKTGLSKQKLSNMMDEETWMDGKEAIEKGFADKLMFDDGGGEQDVINRVRSCINATSFKNIPEPYKNSVQKITQTQKGEPEKMPTIKTVDELVAQFPELTDQLRQSAIDSVDVNKAVEEERARIQAIDELAGKVDNELLNKAKYETFDTAEKVAMEALKTGAFVQASVLTGMKKETEEANGVKGLANGGTPTPADEKNQEKAQMTNHAEQVAQNYLKQIGKGDK